MVAFKFAKDKEIAKSVKTFHRLINIASDWFAYRLSFQRKITNNMPDISQKSGWPWGGVYITVQSTDIS